MKASRIVKSLITVISVIFVGLIVAGLVVGFGDYSKNHWTPKMSSVSVFVFTAIVFVAVAIEFRKSWARLAFWLALLILLTIHLAAYVVLLTFVGEWRIPWFVMVTIIETPFLCQMLDKAGFQPGGTVRTRH